MQVSCKGFKLYNILCIKNYFFLFNLILFLSQENVFYFSSSFTLGCYLASFNLNFHA